MTTTKHKLLWITERFPPLTGGMAESATRQVDGLRQRGWKVDVVLLHFNPENVLTLECIPKDNGDNLLISYPDSPGNATGKAWAEVLIREKAQPYDACVGFGCNVPGHVAGTFAAWLDIPSFVSVRGNDFDRDWFDLRRHSHVESALSRAAAIGTVTIEKREKIKRLFPDKPVDWLPNGIDMSVWQPLAGDQVTIEQVKAELAPDGECVIGIFGELKYKKRIPFWLDAIRDAGLVERFTLLIVGRMDAELDELMTDPALVPEHRHYSFRDRNELLAYYHACDFIVMPSLLEGFPNVLLEGMACGCIPICSRAGAMGDIICDGETGFLFDSEDADGAAMATRHALELTANARGEMKQAVRASVATYSIQHECDELERAIDSIIGDCK